MRTQEARAVEGLAKLLLKLMEKASAADDGEGIYNDAKARAAMARLQDEISSWGLN